MAGGSGNVIGCPASGALAGSGTGTGGIAGSEPGTLGIAGGCGGCDDGANGSTGPLPGTAVPPPAPSEGFIIPLYNFDPLLNRLMLKLGAPGS